MVNFIYIVKEFIYSIYRRINKLPKAVRIETCSLCQLNCRDCYMRKNDSNCIVGSGYLKFDDFKEFIRRNPYIKYIELSMSGEIFLNPELIKILKYGYEKNIVLTAINGVNFNTVSDEILEALVKYQLKGILLSIDGTTNEIYKIYRRNGDLDKVINNIKKLNEYKKRYNSIYPVLEWQYILFKHNIDEIKNILSLKNELKIENVYFKEAWNKEITYNSLSTEQIKLIKEIENQNKTYKELTDVPVCQQIYIQPQINYDGRLLGCCCSTHHELDVNVFEKGLKFALNSPKMKFMRRVIEGREESNNTLHCHWCGYYKEMKKNNKFLDKKQIKFI